MARRDNSDPTGIGQNLNWAFAWPANRRVLYNRASCDPSGKPFNRDRALISWNGTAWGGADIPDFKADEDPTHGMGPFIRRESRDFSPATPWPKGLSLSTMSPSRRHSPSTP
jgi:formate dehydrogenase major subunit